jgi:exonuclease SbcD
MIKFLHISDVHLGCRRYNLDERTKDFFRAWYDVVTKHALTAGIDFMLIAGDFFDRRTIDPQTMNHAVAGLQKLKDAGIPVVVIEGNHDRRDSVSPYSWMRSFCQAGLIILLEPKSTDESPVTLLPWDEERREGSYIDIKGARIYGTHWYGNSTSAAMSLIADSIRQAHDPRLFNILMLHTDVEGHVARPYIPALPVERLKELKTLVDYVALGHTHKRFEVDNWAFNPGSLEACTVDEHREERGIYLVEVGDDKQVRGTHLTDYFQRPFRRVTFDVSGAETAEAVHDGVVEKLKLEVQPHDPDSGKPAPIIEVILRGHLGFKNSDLPLQRIRDEARALTGALHVMVKNQSVPVEYAVAADLAADATRAQRERRIVEDLIARNNHWRGRAPEMASLVLEAKRLVLADESPSAVLDLIEQRLDADAAARAEEKEEATPAPATPPAPSALRAVERNAATAVTSDK